MNDQELTYTLTTARDALNASLNQSSAEISSSYALTSIAASLYIIAERTVNLPRIEKDAKDEEQS